MPSLYGGLARDREAAVKARAGGGRAASRPSVPTQDRPNLRCDVRPLSSARIRDRTRTAGAPCLSLRRPRAQPSPHALLRARAPGARRARARPRLRAHRPARAGARSGHHRRGPAGATRLSRPVRACRRRRGPAVRRRRVRPRLLLKRDRARRAGATRGLRRRAAARRARLVRADARLLLPARAALAAAVRTLASRGAAQALLASGRRRQLGGDLAFAPRRGAATVRPGAGRALRAAGQELGVRAPAGELRPAPQPPRRPMLLLTPLITRKNSRTIPTELKRYIAASEMRLPRSFSPTDHSTCPPSSGKNGNRLITASTSEM